MTQALGPLAEITGPGCILASYMRSGSIWLRTLLYDYDAGLRGQPLSPERPSDLALFSPHMRLENFSDTLARGRGQFLRQIIKTHKRFDEIEPIAGNKRIVLLFRNPADALASAWRKHTQAAFQPVAHTKEDWQREQDRMRSIGPDKYCLDRVPHWKHHVETYADALEAGSAVLMISYENLQADSAGSLMRVARFFAYEENAGAIEAAVENRAFARMKAAATGAQDAINIDQGETGSAKALLRPETLEQIARLTRPWLDRARALEDAGV